MITALVAALVVGQGYARLRIDEPDSQCLWWIEDTVYTYHYTTDGNPWTPADDEHTAITRSFDSWRAVLASCGSLTLVEGPRSSTRLIGYRSGQANENVVLFRTRVCSEELATDDPCWKDSSCANTHDCWAGSALAWAVTTTSFDPDTGKIKDSDIEFNAGRWSFTTVNAPRCGSSPATTCVSSDVENTATHEIGHVLGLAHFSGAASTMNATAPLGDLSKRVVDPGSARFVCDAYPVGAPARTCRVIPVEDELGRYSGCSAVGGAVPLAALLLLRRRRRSGARLRR